MFRDMIVYTDEYKNGFSLSSLGAILTRESSIDLIPNRTIGTGSPVGRPGSLKSSITLGYRTIKPVIHFSPEEINSDSPFKYYSLDELDDFLTRLFINNYKEFEVEFPELSGRFYKAYFNSAQTPKFYLSDGEVSYVLTCYDPFIYGDEIVSYLSSEPVTVDGSSTHKDTGLTISIPSGQSGSINWIHGGQTTGLVVNPSLANLGDITFNTLERTIKDSGNNNLLPFYNSVFPVVPPEEIHQFTTSETGIKISYRRRYLY